MILLINLIPLLIAAIGFGLSWKLKKLWIAAATVAALFLYFQAQPSYMPKGEITRSAPPQKPALKTATASQFEAVCVISVCRMRSSKA